MINRLTSPDRVAEATAGHHGDDFYPSEWLADARNIALINDRGDVNLFQYERDGVYIGHFFYVSRGREALQVARDMLVSIFSYPEVQVLIGVTPDDKRGAKWLTRKLGFKSHGPVEHVCGPCEMFILTRQEYEKDKA